MITFEEILSCNRHNTERWNKLKEIYQCHRIIPFIGAGMSIPVYDDWRETLRQILDGDEDEESELFRRLDLGLYEEAATYVSDTLSENAFGGALEDYFDENKIDLRINETNSIFLPILFETGPVFTTNFDRVIEHCYNKTKNPFGNDIFYLSNMKKPSALTNSILTGKHALVKIHGDIGDPDSLVFTEEQYDSVYNDTGFTDGISEACRRNVFLFLGCSCGGTDRYAKAFKRLIDSKQISSIVKNYAFLSLPEKKEGIDDNEYKKILRKRERDLKSWGVFPIWYPCGKHESVRVLLSKLGDLSPDVSEINGNDSAKTTGNPTKEALENGKEDSGIAEITIKENNAPRISAKTARQTIGSIFNTVVVAKKYRRIENAKPEVDYLDLDFSETTEQLFVNGLMTYEDFISATLFENDVLEPAAKMISKKTGGQQEQRTNGQKHENGWFADFYRFASESKEEELRLLWAAILCQEYTHPGAVSCSLLRTVAQMTKEQALSFCNISRFAMRGTYFDEIHLLLFIRQNAAAYANSKITVSELKALERLGLIECSFYEEYVFNRLISFRYGNHQIDVRGDVDNRERIKAGNAIFTKEGKALYEIVGENYKAYRQEILDFNVEQFMQRNCRVFINGREIR